MRDSILGEEMPEEVMQRHEMLRVDLEGEGMDWESILSEERLWGDVRLDGEPREGLGKEGTAWHRVLGEDLAEEEMLGDEMRRVEWVGGVTVLAGEQSEERESEGRR